MLSSWSWISSCHRRQYQKNKSLLRFLCWFICECVCWRLLLVSHLFSVHLSGVWMRAKSAANAQRLDSSALCVSALRAAHERKSRKRFVTEWRNSWGSDGRLRPLRRSSCWCSESLSLQCLCPETPRAAVSHRAAGKEWNRLRRTFTGAGFAPVCCCAVVVRFPWWQMCCCTSVFLSHWPLVWPFLKHQEWIWEGAGLLEAVFRSFSSPYVPHISTTTWTNNHKMLFIITADQV